MSCFGVTAKHMLKRARARDACEKYGWFGGIFEAEGGRKSFIRTSIAVSATEELILKGVLEFTSTALCVVYVAPAVTCSEYCDGEGIL
jgi:hypothetical protein